MSFRRTRIIDPTTPDVDLVAAVHDGSSEAFDLLVDRYRRFVRARSRGYFLLGGDREDLEQEALIGFYKAVRDFRPDLATSFRGFAELCINRQLITAIKTANRKKHAPLNTSVSISAGRGTDDDEDLALECTDPFADPLDHLVAREDHHATRELLADRLSPLEVDVVTRFVAGHSYEAIAEALGRQVKTVDNALQRVKRKLGADLDVLAPAV